MKIKHCLEHSLLFSRAGNAGAAVLVDTRTKRVRAKKGGGSYRRQDKHRGKAWA